MNSSSDQEENLYDAYSKDSEVILQETRARIIQQILASDTGVLSIKELSYRNPSINSRTIRNHVKKLVERNIIAELTVDEERQLTDFPWKFYAASKKGILLMMQNNIYDEIGVWSDMYDRMKKSGDITELETWGNKPSAPWYSEISEPPEDVKDEFPTIEKNDEQEVSIVLVEDEPDIADLYKAHIDPQYNNTHTIHSGERAIEFIDKNPDVDIFLVDRLLGDVNGDDIVQKIENENIDPIVAMLTAVFPGASIFELPIDDYIMKPVTTPQLLNTLEQLEQVHEYDDKMRELYSLNAKLQAASRMDDEKRIQSSRYLAIMSKFDELRRELNFATPPRSSN